jgi:DNA (cytosine-5)-methyltransferase 1
MALGMRWAGFHHHALIEWNHNATKVLRHNATRDPALWKADAVLQEDVRRWLGELTEVPEVTLVAGGPPCQPFSLAGVHAGDNDDRNMFPAALDIVRTLLPQLVVFENVPGLTRPSFAPYHQYVQAQLTRPAVRPKDDEMWSDHFARILRSQAVPRYHVYEEHVEAADLGVPQNRRRVVLVAIRADIPGAATWPGLDRHHSQEALLHDQYIESVYWDRHDLPQPDVPDRLRARVAQLKGKDPPTDKPWRTLRDALVGLPEPLNGEESPGVANHRGIPGARVYRKHTGSPIDWPSKAIKAGVHGVAGGEAMIRFLDGTLRYLTLRESARVQSFPDAYEFPGPRSRVMGVIGNAVAVAVAEAIGRSLIEHCNLPVADHSDADLPDSPHTPRPDVSARSDMPVAWAQWRDQRARSPR